MHDLDALTGDVLSRFSPATPLGAVVYLLVFVVVAALLSRALRAAVHVALSRHGHVDRTTFSFLQQFGSAFIWVAMLILYAHLIPVLRAMGTALLAGASIASVVIGLAAQSTLGNLIAGVSITIYRPFRIGDTLQVAAPTGTEIGVVEQLSLGYTTLQTRDGRRVVLPNNLAASQVTINLSGTAAMLAPIRIHVDAGVDGEAVRLAALSIARERIGDAVLSCHLIGVDAKGSTLELHCRLAGAGDAAQQRSDLMAALSAKVAGEGPTGWATATFV